VPRKPCYNNINLVNILFMVYFYTSAEYTIHIRGIRKIKLKGEVKMNLIRFFMSESYRAQYTKDFSDRLEKEQQQEEAAYKDNLNNSIN
jgi:hypothetical protein